MVWMHKDAVIDDWMKLLSNECIMNDRKPSRLNLGHQLMLSAAVVASAFGPLFVGLTEARQNPGSPAAAEAFVFSNISHSLKVISAIR